MSPEALKKCLWTCVAYKRFPFPEQVSMDHKFGRNTTVIPAMPTNPFLVMDDLVEFMMSLTQGPDGEMLFLYDGSLMTIWGANQVPIKGNLDLMPEPFRSSTAAANDRSDDLYPRGLERENIGSNDGLARVMRRFYDERHMGTAACTKYSAFTADVNIFDRCMKVRFYVIYFNIHSIQICYDASDGGKMLRQNASIWLAPWHNYKHAVELVWKQYANMLFAPLFHNLYPQNKFIIKYPSPQEPTMFMLFVAKAYPMFKPQLVGSIDRLKAGHLVANHKRLAALRDIQILCEFLIPAVP